MHQLPLLLLLLLASTTTSSPVDTFDVHGSLNCSLAKKSWCWEVKPLANGQLLDRDVSFHGCGERPSIDYKVTGKLRNDGPTKGEFYLGVSIFHTCTKTSVHAGFRDPSLQKVVVGVNLPHSVEYNYTLPGY